MTEQEIRDYIRFMGNPAKSHNCGSCPENEHRNNDTLPCGQQHCWVDVTIASGKEEEY